MSADAEILTPSETTSVLAGSAFVQLDGQLHASYRTTDFRSALELVNRAAAVAEELHHHPEVRLGYGAVTFRLHTFDVGGVTVADLTLALRIQELADMLGAHTSSVLPARYDVAIDCMDPDAIRPFWQVGLGYVESIRDGEVDLVDPRGTGPLVWFQVMALPRTERNRIHLDVYLPLADAPERVEAVIEAGGTLLTDEFAPDWWVLADPEGNELCVCTSSD
jgi:4a-hydroxytetrahydrobiopterin dehydratase